MGVIAIAGLFAYQFWLGNHDKIDSASPKDARFVLNWCELGEQRIEKVLHSFVSARSLTGDYLDAYAIKISHVEIEELTSKTDEFRTPWYRGDQLPEFLDDAVEFVAGWLYRVSWFPSEIELRSANIYIFPWRVLYHGNEPTAVELIFIRPADEMIFFMGTKT